MIVCIGAATPWPTPSELLRSLPGALSEIGSAVRDDHGARSWPQSDAARHATRALRGQPARCRRFTGGPPGPETRSTARSCSQRRWLARLRACAVKSPPPSACSPPCARSAACSRARSHLYGSSTPHFPLAGCPSFSSGWRSRSPGSGSGGTRTPAPRTVRTRGAGLVARPRLRGGSRQSRSGSSFRVDAASLGTARAARGPRAAAGRRGRAARGCAARLLTPPPPPPVTAVGSAGHDRTRMCVSS